MRTQPTGCSLPAGIGELTPLLVGRSLLLGSHPRVGVLRSRLGFADPLLARCARLPCDSLAVTSVEMLAGSLT